MKINTEHSVVNNEPEIFEQTQDQQLDLPKVPATRKKVVYLLVAAALFLLLATSYRLTRKESSSFSEPTDSPQNVTQQSITGEGQILSDAECAALKYTNKTNLDLSRTLTVSAATKQDILLRLNDQVIITELVKPALHTPIMGYQYNPDAQLIVYMVGMDPFEDPSGTTSVRLYDLANNTDEEIFSYKTTPVEEKHLSVERDRLSGFSISQDGKNIVITSNSNVWIYSISAKSIRQVYSDPESTATSVLRSPELSPDGTKVLLVVGHYEGSSSAVLDLTTSTLIELPYHDYHEGETPLAWEGTELLVLKHYNESEFCVADWTGNEKKCGLKLPFNTFGGALDEKKNIVVHHDNNEPSGTYVCNNINSTYMVNTNITSLVLGNLETGETDTIFEIDSTDSSGVDQEYSIESYGFVPINGIEKLVVKLRTKNQVTFIAIDPSTPSDYQVLNFE